MRRPTAPTFKDYRSQKTVKNYRDNYHIGQKLGTGAYGEVRKCLHKKAEFTCAINGHLMKEPVRSVHGVVFEQSTIALWLSSRGSVCPITHKPLTADDLKPDADLRTQVRRILVL